MPHRQINLLLGGLLTVLLIVAPAASAAGPADVTLRAEGQDRTLVPRTAVRTDTRTVNKSGTAGQDCTGTSAAGALEIGTGGDWAGNYYDGFGYTVEAIKREVHTFSDPETYSFWINNRFSADKGICSVELQDGDEVLFFTAPCDYDSTTGACRNPKLPLGLTVPRTAAPGAPFNVKVVEYAQDGTPSPAAGATVQSGTASATTNAEGVAALTLRDRGDNDVRARKDNRARTAEKVCVTDGADGFCGTSKPGQPAQPAAPGAPARCLTTGDDGRCGTVDRRAPSGRIGSIREGQRFARGRVPREISGTVAPDPSGIAKIELRLTRNDRGRCFAYDAGSERLRRTRRCGASRGRYFFVTDRADWSYLLPGVLPRGRYVLDLRVTDRAGNVDRPLQRGRNRIVFRVG
jgi:hypothetical protein